MSANSSILTGVDRQSGDRFVRYGLAACLLLTLAPVAGAILPQAPPALDLAAQFLVPSMLLSLLTLLLGMLARRSRAVIAAAVLLLAAAAVLAPYYAPWRTAAGTFASGTSLAMAAQPVHAPNLRVYFHNTWANNRSPEDTVAAAMASGADVLVFAETTKWRWRLFRPLTERYPNAISCADRDECDLTLLSRAPASDEVVFHDRLSGARGIAATIGDAEHGQVRVIGMHLSRPIPPDGLDSQMNQVNALLRSNLFRPHLPTLVVGDFNAVPWGRIMADLSGKLQLRRIGGIEGSWPAFMPLPLRLRIDQALASADIAVLEQSVEPAHGSDHLALALRIGAAAPLRDRGSEAD